MAASSSSAGVPDVLPLGAVASHLPEPLQNCVYDVSSRAWIPPEAVGRQPRARHCCFLWGFTHQAEKARKAIACRRCGENIEKAAVRVGYPTKGSKGDFGAVVLWCHVPCGRQDPALVAAARGGDRVLRKRVLGYDALRKEERLTFCDELVRPLGEEEQRAEARKFEPPAPTPVRQLEPYEAPAALDGSMLPFQQEGLGWMLAREADPTTRGGILADEMGMGKTLQSIALVLASKARGPTLVVSPAAAMLQWRSELLRFSKKDALNVVLHHSNMVYDPEAKDAGPGRTVVLTTYNRVESDYRREVLKTRTPCPWCHKLFLPAKLRRHCKHYCGPDAESRNKKKQPAKQLQGRGVKRCLMLGGVETSIELGPQGSSQDEAGMHSRPPLEPPMPPQPALSRKRSRPPALAEATAVKEEAVLVRKEGQQARAVKQEVVAVKGEAVMIKKEGRQASAVKQEAAAVKDEAVMIKREGRQARALKQEAVKEEPVEAPPVEEEEEQVQAPPRPRPEPGAVHDECEFDLSQAPLFRERWARVILDEAHRIKGRTNSTAQAVFELRVRKRGARWCLSGTPVQNRVGELWSLLRFLRFHPYAYYFCAKRGCDCSMLRHSFDPDTSRCRKCGHTRLQHQSYFNADVSNPIKRFGFLGAGKAAMEKLRKEVLEKLLLRRTKAERSADICLPPLKIKIKRLELKEEERDIYTATYTKSRTQFDSYVAKGTVLHNYAHIFDLILKLRQAADHPYLVTHRDLQSLAKPPPQPRGPPPAEEALALSDAPDEAEDGSFAGVCALCQDVVDWPSMRMVQCSHIFHRRCLVEYLDEAPKLSSGFVGCPVCFGPIDEGDASAESGDEEFPPAFVTERAAQEPAEDALAPQPQEPLQFRSSAKIDALVEELKRMMERKASSKALVFSQFVRFLQLIEWRLRSEGLHCLKFDGSLRPMVRNSIVLAFQDDPSLKILLISLKAGAEGLNLQAADHIFLMDPWWNPAAELQAIQRAHRIGQTQPVLAKRFVASDTVEERIIELQEKKQSVFDITIGGSNQALPRLTAEDIEFLFGGGR